LCFYEYLYRCVRWCPDCDKSTVSRHQSVVDDVATVDDVAFTDTQVQLRSVQSSPLPSSTVDNAPMLTLEIDKQVRLRSLLQSSPLHSSTVGNAPTLTVEIDNQLEDTPVSDGSLVRERSPVAQ
jgi:hypothetical protein